MGVGASSNWGGAEEGRLARGLRGGRKAVPFGQGRQEPSTRAFSPADRDVQCGFRSARCEVRRGRNQAPQKHLPPARQATAANRTKYYVSYRRNDFVLMKLPKYALPKVSEWFPAPPARRATSRAGTDSWASGTCGPCSAVPGPGWKRASAGRSLSLPPTPRLQPHVRPARPVSGPPPRASLCLASLHPELLHR